MGQDQSHSKSKLEDETEVRWGFLEEEPEVCAVVTDRMELVYLNKAARSLAFPDWFGKRCFERLRVEDDECALSCPTIRDVGEAHELRYFEEAVTMEDRAQVVFGGVVIPLEGASEDAATAVLLLRRKDAIADDATFRDDLLRDAARLHKRVLPHL